MNNRQAKRKSRADCYANRRARKSNYERNEFNRTQQNYNFFAEAAGGTELGWPTSEFELAAGAAVAAAVGTEFGALDGLACACAGEAEADGADNEDTEEPLRTLSSSLFFSLKRESMALT